MSNLLEKASIITTPTAYSDGKLHSVKPVQTLGDELITNGDFATDSNWNVGTGGVITNGELVFSSQNTSGTFQTISHQVGKTYKVSVEIKSVSNGSVRLDLAGGGATTQHFSTVGIHTGYVTPIQGGSFFIRTNAFQGSIDNVSVKEVIDADFDFQRGSAATRLNSQGLIENVQTLSSNLVQNGDFEEIGSEEIVNGDFATDSNWGGVGSNGFSISGGKLNLSDVAYVQNVTQGNVTTVGKIYKVTFEISNYVKGKVRIFLGGSVTPTQTSNGVFTSYVTASANANVGIQTIDGSGTTLSIDNVSVKEVGQNWEFGTDWSMGDGKAVRTGTTSSGLTQSGSFNNNKKYKLEFTISDYVGGSIKGEFSGGGGSDVFFTSTNIGNGTFTFITETTTNRNTLQFYAFNSFNGSIDNISVIEITDDTDLPRIDYTDGCGSLLLEPQSTNLVPYSEPTNGAIGGINNVVSFSDINSFSSIGLYGGAILQGGQTQYIYNGQLISGSTIYAFSFYIKTSDSVAPVLASSNVDALGDFVFVIGGQTKFSNSFSDYSITQFSGNIYKVEAVMTSNANVSNPSNNGLIKFNTNRNADLEITGLQWEQLSYPTSYIPTKGSTATRLADVCDNAGSSDLINSTEGVLYAEISALDDDSNYKEISISDGTSSNRIEVRIILNKISFTRRINGVEDAGSEFIPSSIFEFNKVALRYNSNEYSLFVGGVLVASDTVSSAYSPNTFTSLQFNSGAGSSKFYGNVKSVAVFKEALTNDELEGLTGEGYDTFNALALANNYTII